MRLVMNTLDDMKIVQIWLTNAEKNDPEVAEKLRPLYAENKSRGYMTVVYKSGGQDMKEGMRDLLVYNKRKLAELEVQQEKQAAQQEEESDGISFMGL